MSIVRRNYRQLELSESRSGGALDLESAGCEVSETAGLIYA